MHIRHTAEVLRVHSKRGTENTHAALIVQLAIRLDRIGAEDRGVLMGYTGEEIEVTLRGETLVDPAAPRPMEKLWSNGQGEHTRPGPAETCSDCGKVIGEDPDSDFYAPLAGPPRPVCGDCAVKLDDQQLAEESAAAEEADGTPSSREAGLVDQAPDAAALAAVIGPDQGRELRDPDAPILDGPMPERPADEEPVTTPIRRGRARAETVG